MLILQRKPGESVMIAAAAVNQDSAREEADPAALLDLLSGPPPSSP